MLVSIQGIKKKLGTGLYTEKKKIHTAKRLGYIYIYRYSKKRFFEEHLLR